MNLNDAEEIAYTCNKLFFSVAENLNIDYPKISSGMKLLQCTYMHNIMEMKIILTVEMEVISIIRSFQAKKSVTI